MSIKVQQQVVAELPYTHNILFQLLKKLQLLMEQLVMGGEGFDIIGVIQGKSRHGYNIDSRIM